MYVRMYVCMYVCIYIYIFLLMYTCSDIITYHTYAIIPYKMARGSASQKIRVATMREG